MHWLTVVLIIVGVIIALALIVFVLGKLSRPKFKKAQKYLAKKPATTENVVAKKVETDSAIGLNLDGVFNFEEEKYFEENTNDEEVFDSKPKPLTKAKPQATKTLLEQIRELSPELKALIFDRGLARKEYDFNSKLDWTSITFKEVSMFNFFNEIKSCVGEIKNKYNIVNMSGKLVYVEGHKGLALLSKNIICLKIKKGSIKVEGENLSLKELYEECVKISGKIEKIEVFDAEN